jgi:hypothetical protein
VKRAAPSATKTWTAASSAASTKLDERACLGSFRKEIRTFLGSAKTASATRLTNVTN